MEIAQAENKQLEQQAHQNIIREKDAAIELAIAKNAQLQAQINPHFVYNALNFIFANTRVSHTRCCAYGDTARSTLPLNR